MITRTNSFGIAFDKNNNTVKNKENLLAIDTKHIWLGLIPYIEDVSTFKEIIATFNAEKADEMFADFVKHYDGTPILTYWNYFSYAHKFEYYLFDDIEQAQIFLAYASNNHEEYRLELINSPVFNSTILALYDKESFDAMAEENECFLR